MKVWTNVSDGPPPASEHSRQLYWVAFRGQDGRLYLCEDPLEYDDGWFCDETPYRGAVEYWMPIDRPLLP